MFLLRRDFAIGRGKCQISSAKLPRGNTLWYSYHELWWRTNNAGFIFISIPPQLNFIGTRDQFILPSRAILAQVAGR